MKYNKTLYPFQSKWLPIDGTNIHYVDEGNGQVILFSHAAIGSSFMYRKFIQSLSKHFRCIALDFPGFGLTPTNPGGNFCIVHQSHVLEQFIKRLRLENIIAFGHDTGGPSIFHVCASHPELIKGMILTDTIIFPTPEYSKIHRMLGIVGSAPIRWLNGRTNFLTKVTINKGVATRKLLDEEKAEYYHITADHRKRDSAIQVLSSLRKNPEFMTEIRSGFENQLNRKPTLLIYGENDPVKELGIPDRIHSMMAHAEYFVIKGESHFPHEGQPERMIEIIYQWVSKLGENRSAIAS